MESRESDRKRNRDTAESPEKTGQRAANSLARSLSACDVNRVIESFDTLSFCDCTVDYIVDELGVSCE